MLMLPPAPTVTPPQPMPTSTKSTIEKLKDAQKSFVAIATVPSDFRDYMEFLRSAECNPTFESALMPLLTLRLLSNALQEKTVFGN